jgi:hypothetical protein
MVPLYLHVSEHSAAIQEQSLTDQQEDLQPRCLHIGWVNQRVLFWQEMM